jgi:hypothetical protein
MQSHGSSSSGDRDDEFSQLSTAAPKMIAAPQQEAARASLLIPLVAWVARQEVCLFVI